MTDREFHEMVDELVKYADPTVGMVRVTSALKVAIEVGGAPVAAAVQHQCQSVVRNLIDLGLRPNDEATINKG
jgi:hypothetical protein